MGDGIGTMGRHVQSMDDRVCTHISGTVADLNQALLAIDVALRSTVAALGDKLSEFQGSAKELMDRTHQGLTHLQMRMSEAEKATEELKKQKAPPPQEDRQPPGTAYFDMSSPPRPQQFEAGPGKGWQAGKASWQSSHAQDSNDRGADPWQRASGAPAQAREAAPPSPYYEGWQNSNFNYNPGHARDASAPFPNHGMAAAQD